MFKKIKTITTNSPEDLDDQVNEFIINCSGEYKVETAFSAPAPFDGMESKIYCVYTATIYYKSRIDVIETSEMESNDYNNTLKTLLKDIEESYHKHWETNNKVHATITFRR